MAATVKLGTVDGLDVGTVVTFSGSGDTSIAETLAVLSTDYYNNTVTFSSDFLNDQPTGAQATWESSTSNQAIEPRYRSCFAHKHTDGHKDVLAGLLACFDGWLSPRSDGALVVFSGRYTSPTVSLGPDQIISYSIQQGIDEEDALNQITVTYVSAPHNYNTVDTDPWEDDDDIAARGKILSDQLANQVPSHSQARRLAKRIMAKRMSPQRGTITTNAAGRPVRGQRYVHVDLIECGTTFFSGPVEVTKLVRNIATGGVTFDWIAADPNIDAWSPETEEGYPAPVGNSIAAEPLAAPTITSAVADHASISGDGTGTRIIITGNGPDRDDLIWFARWRVVGAAVWNEAQYSDTASGAAVSLETGFVPTAVEVEVEIAYEWADGRVSPWSLALVVGTTAPPSNVDFANVSGATKPQDGATRNVSRGAWASGTIYSLGDMVSYSDGASYVAKGPVPAGTVPTNTTYWTLLVAAGIPGPAGANGQPTYFHIAYADNADGTQGLINDPSGKAYIGVYSDGNGSSSLNPSAYAWSRLTGVNGLNGANGTPGPIGADGRQSYVHFAYADSINGSANFTTGNPGGRGFIGVYSDYTLADSTDPNAYAWSLIRGADGSVGPPGSNGANGVDGLSALNIHTVGAVSWDGHNLTCTSGAGNWTTNGAYSGNVIPGGVALSFQRPNWYGNEDAFFGISSSPTVAIDYPAVEFAWRMQQSGSSYIAEIWHAGSGLYSEGWDGGSNYSIRYDANTGVVTWYRNDTAIYTYNAGAGRSFGLEMTAGRNVSIANVAFTAAGGTGATGGAGPPGGKGDPGNPGAPGPPGANGSNGVSPSPKYVAVTVNYVPTYYTYPNPIPLDNGQTLTLEAYGSCSASYTNGPPGVVAFSLQISLDGGASYSQIAADQTGGMNDGDGQDLDVIGSYTNTSGSRQTITARLFANRNGQAGTSAYGTFQPS